MIEEIGIDSIYDYGKTNKLDAYIAYNFSNLLGDSETLQWASEVRVRPLEINSNIYPRWMTTGVYGENHKHYRTRLTG